MRAGGDTGPYGVYPTCGPPGCAAPTRLPDIYGAPTGPAGSGGERRCNEMSEHSPSGGCEGYGICIDDVGRGALAAPLAAPPHFFLFE